MSHHSHQEPQRPSTETAPNSVLNLPLEPQTAAKLDAYLNTICRNLPASVPEEATREMRLEMRGHLLSAITAHRELGQTQEEAFSSAFAQFGEPKAIARKWRQEWENTLAKTNELPFSVSFRRAAGVWSVAYACLLGMGVILRHFPTMPDSFRAQLTLIGVFVLPLIAGGLIGLSTRRRTIVTNALASVSVLPLYLLIIMIQLDAIKPGGWKSALWFAINPFLLWLPLSSVSAAVTAQISKFAKRLQTAR